MHLHKIIFLLCLLLLSIPSHAEDYKPQAFFSSGDTGVFNDLQSGELLQSITNDNRIYYLEQNGDIFEEDIATIDPEIQGLTREAYSFSKSKRLLATQVYPKHPIAFYSGCRYKTVGKKLIPIHSSCGFKYRKNKNRSQRIEWEHVVPAWLFGHQLRCWQQGGRLNCRNSNATFKQMEADMHNLVPAIGEINGDRSNYKYGMISGEQRLYGKPDMEVSFAQRMAEPPKSVFGDIARTYFFMVDKYDLKISNQQKQLFIAWNNLDPVDAWEYEKNKRLKKVQGDENLYITHYKKLKQGDIVDSRAGETFAEIKTELAPIFAFLYGYLPAWIVNLLLLLTVAVIGWYRRRNKKVKELNKTQKKSNQSQQTKKKTTKVSKARKGILSNAIKANEVYYLQPQLVNKLLSLDDDKQTVITTEKNIINTQSWQLIPTNKQEGFIFIQKTGTNQVLEVKGEDKKDGAKIGLATRKRRSNDHQEWKLVALEDNSHWYFIQNRATQNVLDVAYKKTKEGTRVVSYHKKVRGYENQLWLLDEV
ncbi:MAG: endonuclease [Cocleimonas sp.]|nr:endonuclease [Cocleimonas sp.]